MSLRNDIASMPRTVWVLFLGTLINRFGSFVFVFLAVYLTGKGYSAPQAGLAIGAYGVGAICASLVGGWLADHMGRRNSIVLSMTLSAAVMMALSQAEGYALLMSLTALAGFCAELYRPAATALIADVTTPVQRVTAFALYRLAINAGFAIGPAVGGLMAHKSFFLLFLGDAVTSLVYAGIAIAALPNRVVGHHVVDKSRSALRTIMRDPGFLMFLGSTMAGSIVFMQHVSSYPLQIAALGYSSSVFGMLISMNGLLICLTELPLTSYTRRQPPRRVMVIGMLVFGAGFALTGLAKTIPWLAATVVIWTVGEMFYFPMAAAHVANISPHDMRGRYQGAWGISWGLGAVIGPVLGTALFSWKPGVVWLACGLVAALGSLLILPATREQRVAKAATEAP
jgi:MFS family permease